jgi:hypothetical protein
VPGQKFVPAQPRNTPRPNAPGPAPDTSTPNYAPSRPGYSSGFNETPNFNFNAPSTGNTEEVYNPSLSRYYPPSEEKGVD